MSALRLTGTVEFRSSLPNASGPPGETKILSLNPQRKTGILGVTQWPSLEPGSLNLAVSNEVIYKLKKLTPTWEEDGAAGTYPLGFEHIPRKRGAYLYYLAEAQAFGKRQAVLVRTARNALGGRDELFAAVSLRGHLGLREKDCVVVEVNAT